MRLFNRPSSLRRAYHEHRCITPGCQNFWTCTRRDGCDHEDFCCPDCELDARDRWANENESHEQERA